MCQQFVFKGQVIMALRREQGSPTLLFTASVDGARDVRVLYADSGPGDGVVPTSGTREQIS